MKISIENLGPLTHAEFELKPLTVFIGDNRQGKTQAIVTATTMLGDYGLREALSHLSNSNSSKLYELIPEIKKLYDDLINTSQAEINLVEFSRKYLPHYYANLGKFTLNHLSEILGSTVPVKKTAVTHTLSEMEITEILSQIDQMDSSEILDYLEIPDSGSPVIPKIRKEHNSPILYLSVDANQKRNLLQDQTIILTLLNIVLVPLHRKNIRNLYFFPSERAGLYLLVSELHKRHNQALPHHDENNHAPSRSDENRPKIFPSYAPNNYMGLIIYTLMEGSRNKRLKNPEIAKIEELSALFTTIITQDTISISSPEPRFPRKVQMQVYDTVLDVQAVSSGVKGLIGLSLYLQYKARPGDLIVIDEPEQNLHPNQQVAFAEFLTLLVNNGIRIAITTHSPYIIEHLQNLILAHDLKDKKEIIDSLCLKREDSLIDKEKVGVYLFQNGTAENILREDGEINWQTFCDTASTMENITSLIYGKMPNGHRRDE